MLVFTIALPEVVPSLYVPAEANLPISLFPCKSLFSYSWDIQSDFHHLHTKLKQEQQEQQKYWQINKRGRYAVMCKIVAGMRDKSC